MELGINKIKNSQHRLTKQRLAILNYLKNTTSHPNAETILSALKPQIANLSLATVYRNLKYLHQIGLIKEVRSNQKTTHFDGNDSLHFHFICNQCQKITDIFDQSLINLPLITDKYPLTDKINLNIYGTCLNCRT